MKNHQHINSDSGIFEYYTPAIIVEAARRTMGGIDLDPASSLAANKRIRASRIFTEADNGLSRPWGNDERKPRVWMNHPFSRENNYTWIKKLDGEFRGGNLLAACCITFAATSEKWFRPLMQYPQCYLSPRTNYHLPDGTLKRGVTKGSVVTYLGSDLNAFREAFENLGAIKI